MKRTTQSAYPGSDAAPVFRFAAPPPLSLYVHLPWCVRKCPYCDFNSHAVRGEVPHEAYVDALLRDLDRDAPTVAAREVQSLFIGGGTPSLFPAPAVARLLAGVRECLSLAAQCEITLEANPGAVEAERFAGYRKAGVNRISLGVQSFDDALLARIGRIHDAAAARRAVAAARSAGFANLNLDLMYGLPGQTPEGACTDLEQAIALEPAHVSHYQLTIEPNTAFHRRPPPLPGEDAAWAMQQRCSVRLAAAGYARYEVSAWAREGARCRHNLNYWRFGDYLGVGAGAHAKLTDAGAGRIRRTVKQKHPRRYLETAGGAAVVLESRDLSPAETAFEFMLNALRLSGGFPETLFTEATGLAPGELAATLERAQDRELLERAGGCIRPTELGARFLNELLELFLPPESGRAALA